MKILSLLEKNTRKNLLLLFPCGLLFELSNAALLPIIPAYLQEICSTIQEVGLVMGFFAIGLILSRNFLGHMADKQGRKVVILIGTISGVLVPLGYLSIKSLYGLIFIRILGGISLAAFSTAYDALVVDWSPHQYKGEIISYMNLISPLSFCLGPLIGDLISQAIGYDGIFAVSLVICLLAVIFALKVKNKNTYANHNHQPINNFIKNKSIRLLNRDSFLIPTIVMLLMGINFGALITFLPLYIKELSINFNTGIFYSVAAIASFIIRFISGNASDRYGRGIFITTSIVCYGIAMFILSQANTSFELILAAIIEGAAIGIIFPLVTALVSDRCGMQERGRVFALCLGGFDIGLAIAGPVLSYVAAFSGYQTLYSLATLIAVYTFIIFITLSNKTIKNSLGFAFGLTKDYHQIQQQE